MGTRTARRRNWIRKTEPIDDQRKLTRKDPALICRECGRFLENTAGGNFAICPDYHGKLRRRLTERELAFLDACRRADQATAMAEGAAEASKLRGGRWDVLGTVCKRGRFCTPAKAAKLMDAGTIVALVDGRHYRFEPIEKAEA
jgi:hypothetical protein